MNVDEMLRELCEKNGWTAHARSVELPLDDGRKQEVFRLPLVHDDAPAVRFYSVLGRADSLSETRLLAALSVNFSLQLGALALHEEQLVMVDTVLLSACSSEAVEASIRFVGETADQYEKAIFGTDQH